MACGRSENQSNLVAVFMLQQHDKCHGLVVASRHKLERLTSGDIPGACIWRDGGLSARLAGCGLPIGCARRFASRTAEPIPQRLGTCLARLRSVDASADMPPAAAAPLPLAAR